MKVLTWYVPTPLEAGTNQRETYRLDGDYLPVRAWVHLREAPTGTGKLVVDINVDGVSAFSVQPTLLRHDTDTEETAFSGVQFSKDALITLDIDELPDGEKGKDMTVGLELE